MIAFMKRKNKGKQKGEGKGKKGNNNGKGRDGKPQITCYTCGRPGHTSTTCYHNTKGKNFKGQQQGKSYQQQPNCAQGKG
eukprot:6434573-Amphidinium_carterae.4